MRNFFERTRKKKKAEEPPYIKPPLNADQKHCRETTSEVQHIAKAVGTDGIHTLCGLSFASGFFRFPYDPKLKMCHKCEALNGATRTRKRRL